MKIINTISEAGMREFLSRSLPSINDNKINGMSAETEFRKYLEDIGFGERISVGGWIVRKSRKDFSHEVAAIFPEIINIGIEYDELPKKNVIPHKLHTICATFHQLGIKSYYSYPLIKKYNDTELIEWFFKRLGIPQDEPFNSMEMVFRDFVTRDRRYNFLRNKSVSDKISINFLPSEFSKENLRIAFQNRYMSELSDIDGIFWGEQFTYPIEIKEKTVAHESSVGDFFGIDVGPFVKLAYFAAKKGNLHSLFVVRQIDDQKTRNLVNWKFVTFDKLAQFASWVPMGGGTNMRGGGSTVIKVPAREFEILNEESLRRL